MFFIINIDKLGKHSGVTSSGARGFMFFIVNVDRLGKHSGGWPAVRSKRIMFFIINVDRLGKHSGGWLGVRGFMFFIGDRLGG